MTMRIFSAALFLLGVAVMIYSSSSIFFGPAASDPWGYMGMALFGFVLALFSYFMLGASRDDPSIETQWRIYSMILFVLGFIHLTLNSLTILLRFSAISFIAALISAVGGLILCVVSYVFLTSAPPPAAEESLTGAEE